MAKGGVVGHTKKMRRRKEATATKTGGMKHSGSYEDEEAGEGAHVESEEMEHYARGGKLGGKRKRPPLPIPTPMPAVPAAPPVAGGMGGAHMDGTGPAVPGAGPFLGGP